MTPSEQLADLTTRCVTRTTLEGVTAEDIEAIAELALIGGEAGDRPVASGSIDLATAGYRAIFTCPAGKVFIFGRLMTVRTSASGGVSARIYKLRANFDAPFGAGSEDILETPSMPLPAAGYLSVQPESGVVMVAPVTEGLTMECSSSAVATGTYYYELFGRLMDVRG